ncbi:MAG: CoA-binding protein [Lapillicoccus sp.]
MTPETTDRSWVGPGARARLDIMRATRTVAVVGASPNPARASYFVATYLLASTDYETFFVNPVAAAKGETILGREIYPDLASLPVVPDMVDVFRRSQETPAVVAEAAALGVKTVWLQLGVWSEEAAETAEAAGMAVVMDRCLKIEHARFHGGLHLFGFDTGQISARTSLR